MRAFAHAKNRVNKNKYGDDLLEFAEFRFFLLSLRQYFEYFDAFMRVDVDDDNRIDLQEF